MGFLAVCTALYDYKPQSAGELEIKEGELLYILEKSADDDWWKAKKKADGDDDDEPEGLIPNNYVEDARPTHAAKALYDYTRQTDEEVSFSEDAALSVYDTSDPDWTLVGVAGDFGFAPANYIELSAAGAAAAAAPATPKSPSVLSNRQSLPLTREDTTPASPVSPVRSASGPAAHLANVLSGRSPTSPVATRTFSSPPPPPRQEPTPDFSDAEDEPKPDLPRRPPSQTIQAPPARVASYHDEAPGIMPSPPIRGGSRGDEDDAVRSPGGFHLYNINEMVSAMGRRRKMPTTLGVNIATGTIMLSPEKSRDGPTQEWTADKMTHYSIEGKHVFIELVRPSKSLDLHAGAKDTAEEIVAALGEIAGAQRAEGFREVMAAATGAGTHKKGHVLYDFMAQGDDEVTVGVGDEVIVLDDTKSEEWWNVRRLKNGKEGVVPSSYIEVTGYVTLEPESRSGINAGLSVVEQNRLEEERLAKAAAKADRRREEAEQARAHSEVGPGLHLPQRGSSLAEEQSPRRERRDDRRKSRARPDAAKVRTWTDHSGTFKVEAQFLGVADGKIHLHKVNGVKIAVPVTKMSPADLAYIEKVTNESIEEHIPVADLIKMKRRSQASDQGPSRSGATIEPKPEQPKAPEYDWFSFFLEAGVGPHQCERYSQAMVRDSMDESVLPDVTQDTLRTLGLKEGDALKVMKFLDQKYGRTKGAAANGDATAGIFSEPGKAGGLKNNSGRERPAPNKQAGDVVDPDAFKGPQEAPKPALPAEAKATPLTQAPAREPKDGFEDDAWTVKQPQQAAAPPPPAPAAVAAAAPAPKPPTGALKELSILDTPLVPTPAQPQGPPQQQQQQQQPAPQPQPPPQIVSPPPPMPPQQPQQTGANPSFFAQLNQQPAAQQQGMMPQQQMAFSQPVSMPRQRPQAPQQNFTGPGLLPPPPRPTSAPNAPQTQLGLRPLQPQLTGIPQTAPGHSLNDLTQQRIQQQYQQQMQLQPQPTGFIQQQPNQGFAPFGMQPQPTGFPAPQQLGQFQQQPYLNGNAQGSPFADPRPVFSQPTGIPFQQSPPPGGINSVLPPALLPQQTGFQPQPQMQLPQTNGFQQQQFQPQPQSAFSTSVQPQPTGFQPMQPQPTGFNQMQQQQNGFNTFQAPPVPPIPQQPTLQPLVAQKTGPAPPVRFGVQEPKKLTPQPTGRANLAKATADNPFGF